MIRCYRIGDGVLRLDCDDAPLTERFEAIYGECATESPADWPALTCTVRSAGPAIQVAFDDPEDLDVARFAAAVFPGRPGMATASRDGRRLTADPDADWRPFVANLAVSRLQRSQRHLMFFHAASLAVGARGVLACGPKRSGKTTLAMALASRGHDLFGDELAALRLETRELLPIRRSLAVREGPSAPPVRAALEMLQPAREIFPDGESRARARVASLFPPPAAPAATLTTVLLLRKFSPSPAAEPVASSAGLLPFLTPLAASLWERPAGMVAVQLMRLLAAARIFRIDAGPPDATAAMIERLVEST